MLKMWSTSMYGDPLANSRLRYVMLLATLLMFAVLGVYLLSASMASTPPVSVQPELGQRSGSAVVVADTAASGGSGVKFGASDIRTVLWKSDFSKGKASYNPEVEDASANASFPVVDGQTVLRIKAVQGTDDGYKFMTRFGHIGVPQQTEVYMKYELFLPSAANMSYRGKLPGLGGLPDSQGGWYTSSGGNMKSDSFSVRLHPRPSTEYSVGYPWFDAYIYAWHANGKYYGAVDQWGLKVPITSDLSHSHASKKTIRIPQGRWFPVQMRVKLNTPGVNNGVLEMWIDGVKGVSISDVQWRKSGVNTNINQLVGNTFANLPPGYPNTFNIDMRNYEIWKQ